MQLRGRKIPEWDEKLLGLFIHLQTLLAEAQAEDRLGGRDTTRSRWWRLPHQEHHHFFSSWKHLFQVYLSVNHPHLVLHNPFDSLLLAEWRRAAISISIMVPEPANGPIYEILLALVSVCARRKLGEFRNLSLESALFDEILALHAGVEGDEGGTT